jgi:hypothetical protein
MTHPNEEDANPDKKEPVVHTITTARLALRKHKTVPNFAKLYKTFYIKAGTTY